MFRILSIFLFVTVMISGCNTTENPTDSTDIPGYVGISVTSEPDTLASGATGSYSTVTVSLTDEFGSALPEGLPVHFTTNIGSIQTTATTDKSGQAIVRYTPSPEPGVAQINATYEGVHGPVEGGGSVCIVDPRNPVGFLVSADPQEIYATGFGMNSTSIVSAIVLNGLGEPVTEDLEVTFELVREDMIEGSIGTLNGNDETEIVESIDGIAIVGYNAPGQLRHLRLQPIQISTTDLDNNLISHFAHPVVINPAKLPFQIEIDISTVGIDVGGGAWQMEVSAKVWDANRNPVADDIPVVFSVEPEIAIVESGFTGNVSSSGYSEPGVAFAELVYNSSNTFDHIEISAEVQSDRGWIHSSYEAILPLQQGQLDLFIDPGNWQFNEDNEDAVIRCWALLKDGHGVLINSAPIHYTVSKSQLWWHNIETNEYESFFPEPSIKYTGIVDRQNGDSPGIATVYLRGRERDFFFDPFTMQTEVVLEAKVLGYESETLITKTLVVTRGN
ncbi:MAG: hypothetical protein HN590_05675 [Calditrichaeota bacterium]|jgi:hypothetical protein|nr:hypothetical protein [Calditrichota bacterium]MBT7790696.1 hypothetical protein [Calditrichota bacterium]